MKKTLLASAALAFALGISSAAMAQGNSVPGDERYAEISGNPADNAQCDSGAGSGAFGYLGKDLNPGVMDYDGDGEPGVRGHVRTGPNNSGVCGDPNDVLPN
ncbi:MAG: hypothetical protein WEB85_08210 [Dongiaceae bacterium]